MVAAILRLLLSDAGPYSITCPGPAAAPAPTLPPALRRFTAPCPSPAATHAPSDHASTAADRHDRHASSLSTAYNTRNISQYYTPARQLGGGPLASLSRARAEFTRVCEAFFVPASTRATCLPFSVRQSDLKLPALLTASRARSESQLWDFISARGNTRARVFRARNMLHATTLAGQPALPDDAPVRCFDRMLPHVFLFQAQLPSSFKTVVMRYDKLIDATRTVWFAHAVLALPSDNHNDLISHIQLLLTASPPPDSPPPTPPGPALSTAAFVAGGAPADSPRPGESFLVDVEDQSDDASKAWYIFKRFRAHATRPYRTEGTTLCRPPPSRDHHCHNCGAPDHFARTGRSPRRSDPSTSTRANLDSLHTLSSNLPALTPSATPAAPDTTPDPPSIPSQPPPALDYDAA